ncbi:MAG: hypothetical protein NC390_04115 [Fusobacterium sp.]|nr:hypothetical protein [Fusobacterium sp.]
MSVKPVSVKLNNRTSDNNKEVRKQPQYNLSQQNGQNVAFGNAANAVVMFMDGIERGGFVASFMAQDCCGMVAPRIYEGLNRNKEETGHLNWEFAKREGIRECLSGPSVFVIPASILYFVKKYSGTANNVPVDFIKAFGGEFGKYASGKNVNLADTAKTQTEFYEQVYKNVLKTSTAGAMPEEELNATAKKFADELTAIRDAKSKGFFKNLSGKVVEGSKEDLMAKLSNEFIAIKKRYTAPAASHWVAELQPQDAKASKISASFSAFSDKLLDYTKDTVEHTKQFVDKNKNGNLAEFIKGHTTRRMGSRALTNVGMWLAVVGFYFMIPKIYSMGLDGKNPGMAGLEEHTPAVEETKNNNNANNANNADKVSFSGKKEVFTNVAEKVMKNKHLKKASDFFEFDGASMTTNSTLALLFGFCLPTRLANSTDHHDRKEIWTRDLFSFASILFGANALSRGFSKIFAGVSGLALNVTPDDHEKSFMHKFKNYFSPTGGIGVLKSGEITAKYSNIQDYKDGINGFFEFVQENGGNLKRMLAIDPEIKQHAEKVMGKELEHCKNAEIEEVFKKTKNSKHVDAIVDILKNPDNKLVKKAKMLNSTFGAASIVLFVPAFMIWLAKHCEKMTKADVSKEKFQEIAKRYMHDDFASADLDTIKALDEKVLEDIKANKIYGFKYDRNKNMIRDLTGKEKQVSDVRVEIKKYVDMAVPKGQKRVVHKMEKQAPQAADYNSFLASQNQFKNRFLANK